MNNQNSTKSFAPIAVALLLLLVLALIVCAPEAFTIIKAEGLLAECTPKTPC